MKDSAARAGEITLDDAVRLAQAWAAAHHADAGRSRNFAVQWHQDTPVADRRGDALLRDLEFFFQAASKDAAYWQSVGDFSEEATGVWGMQALKALAGLNAVGLLAAAILLAARGGSAYTAGAIGACALFLAGVILAYPALRLTRLSRARANAAAASHSREAGSAWTWEQLRSANDANPNVGRKERKLAFRLAAIMAATATAGCAVLVTTVWL
ncbi:hypothetical protein EUC41_07950 [Achromobacter denitrificans]|uniref:hypothetical protein n=1 Tax=Achromobacter denitrificans TaxID=32002 RepID=UPI000F51522F|nr:hypothetical protein [Achromobacter denitrificans]MBV2159868.1 hypothetical protein [Achromobacter denitrificans]MDX3879420.1 hypothetical protein [Achromobacter sp.]QCS66716.1 hypothetical protein EC609_32650 [Achromobacter denitrificans]WFC66255.1 hypothetical protein EUC41_07950 [Achromobacter denitrificans]